VVLRWVEQKKVWQMGRTDGLCYSVSLGLRNPLIPLVNSRVLKGYQPLRSAQRSTVATGVEEQGEEQGAL
jgi:hypothetical protein